MEDQAEASSQGSGSTPGMHPAYGQHDAPQHARSQPPSPHASPPISPEGYAYHTASLLDASQHHRQHRRRRKQEAGVARGLHFPPPHPLGTRPDPAHEDQALGPFPEGPGRAAAASNSHDGRLDGLSRAASAMHSDQLMGQLSRAGSTAGMRPAHGLHDEGRPGHGHDPGGLHAGFGSGIDLRHLGVRRESDGYSGKSVAANAMKGDSGMQRTQSMPFRSPPQNGKAGQQSLALPGAFMREPRHPARPSQQAGLGSSKQGPLQFLMQASRRLEPSSDYPRSSSQDMSSERPWHEAPPPADAPQLYECPGLVQHGPSDRQHGQIASLHPSSTGILFALGLGNRIGAVSATCDLPPDAAAVPRLGPAASASSPSQVCLICRLQSTLLGFCMHCI